MTLTINQRKLLNTFLDKYEKSKTFRGTNEVVQKFAVNPVDIWSEYVSDFASMELVRDFETEMHYLQSIGLITVLEKDGVIIKLIACNHKLLEYYDLIQRKRMTDIMNEQCTFFTEWKNKGNSLVGQFCEEQLTRVQSGKKPIYSVEICERLLQLVEFIASNEEELLERELSILLLADSKEFGKTYRSKICKIFSTYTDLSRKLEGIDDDREKEKIILEEYKIYANPSYVHLKGHFMICLKNGQVIRIDSNPMALSSGVIKQIASITVEGKNVVTVENLTSFHRVNNKDSSYIYLAGYHNSEKQAFLRRISRENSGKKWQHFGDIDPDGFYILENLINGTGIEFESLHMDLEMLKTYAPYCKEFEKGDRVKAENLIKKGRYMETLQYMIKNNCKLEQEVISFNLCRD
jgi:hypothetical protein